MVFAFPSAVGAGPSTSRRRRCTGGWPLGQTDNPAELDGDLWHAPCAPGPVFRRLDFPLEVGLISCLGGFPGGLSCAAQGSVWNRRAKTFGVADIWSVEPL